MKKLIAILAVLVLLPSVSYGADLRKLFLAMPDSLMPMLTKNDRMDFLDFMDSGMKASVRNRLGGESVLTNMDDRILTVKTSESASVTLAVYESRNGRPIVCLVTTVASDFSDSSVKFFSEDWTPIPSDRLLKMPSLRDYLTAEALKNDSLEYFEERSILRLQTITPQSDAMVFRYSSLDYIDADAGQFAAWFKPDGVVLRWNGKKFR